MSKIGSIMKESAEESVELSKKVETYFDRLSETLELEKYLTERLQNTSKAAISNSKSDNDDETSEYNVDDANCYFTEKTEKVYVERCNGYGIQSFSEYLKHRYRDNCYYYSFYALMGLKYEDYLVRGNIALDGGRSDYHHGWVEFRFKDHWYVFDSMIKTVVPKEEWYERYKPKIDYKITQRKILKKWLNEKYAVNFGHGFWQFKYFVIDKSKEDLSISEMCEFDAKNGYIPSALKFARIEFLASDRITRFIAYDEPSC